MALLAVRWYQRNNKPRVFNPDAILMNLPPELLSNILVLACVNRYSLFQGVEVKRILPLLLTCRRFHDVLLSQRSLLATFKILDNPPVQSIERQIELVGQLAPFMITAHIMPRLLQSKWYRVFKILGRHGSQWKNLECSQEVLIRLFEKDLFPSQVRDTLEGLTIHGNGQLAPSAFSKVFRKLWASPFRGLRSLDFIHCASGDIRTIIDVLPPPNSVPQLEEFTSDCLHAEAVFGSRDLISFLRSTPLLRILRLRSEYVDICEPLSSRVKDVVILERLQVLYIGCNCMCNALLLRNLVYPNLRSLRLIDFALSNRLSKQLMACIFHNLPYPALDVFLIAQCNYEGSDSPHRIGMDIIRCGQPINTIAFDSNGTEATEFWIAKVMGGLCEALLASEHPLKPRRLYVPRWIKLAKSSTDTLRTLGIDLRFEEFYST